MVGTVFGRKEATRKNKVWFYPSVISQMVASREFRRRGNGVKFNRGK